ncbi:MAG: hypothetical protein ACI93P_000225 [bacterium]|jgi:hypothetical protein
MKKNLTICLLLFGSILYSQITLIPDQYFEQFLIDINIDSDGVVNGQVLTSDIENLTELDVYAVYLLTDLTGLEDFVSLTILTLEEINITTVNLSNLIALENLHITDVSLESLDITNNINLKFFNLTLNGDTDMYFSPLTSIDFSNNTQLLSFVISRALITELDFSNNINLQGFSIFGMEELEILNIKNGNNTNIPFLQIHEFNVGPTCFQVDDPQAVIDGVLPPYDNWTIDVDPIITDDCSLGVNDYLKDKIIIAPNPSKNYLQITYSNHLEIKTIKIYDVLGKLVCQENNPLNNIDISKLNSGLLFIKIETENGIFTKKVIKE